uniref:Uncharacterized protein n=1 Tax=Meloidogyne incognita TaxID=6306 RepID=A0A914L5Y2_MELIC
MSYSTRKVLPNDPKFAKGFDLTEKLPVLFAYGQRHYRANIKEHFNEKTVRLFCSQIIGTLCDLLDKKLNLFAQEAWIEMVTYLGRALLSGFEHERQKRRKFPLPKNY